MALLAQDNKCGISKTLDPKRHVHKSANNAGRAQPLAMTLNPSVEKFKVVIEKIAGVQESQAVASSFFYIALNSNFRYRCRMGF